MSRKNEAVREAHRKGYRVCPEGKLLNPKGEVLRPRVHKGGYYKMNLRMPDGRDADVQVHRLAAFQRFGEDALAANLIRHLNNNKLDNSEGNLVPGTHSENVRDRPLEVRVAAARKASWARYGKKEAA